MPQFMLVYRGEPTDLSAMTPAEGKAVLDRWQVWMKKVGPALKDVGAPFGDSMSLVDNGKTRSAAASAGYSIVEAKDLAHARKLAESHSYLSEGKGNYAIDIYALKPVPFEA
jgi:hypothetical protein